MYELVDHTENINRLAAFPLCPLPRIISAEEFNFLNRGLSQRVKALNFSGIMQASWLCRQIQAFSWKRFWRLYH